MIGSYMTVAEVAEKLGKTKATITRALVKLGAQKVSGVYLIDEKTFNALAASRGPGRPKGSKNKR